MNRIIICSGLLFLSILLLSSTFSEPNLEVNADTPVWEVLKYFGEPDPNHTTTETNAEIGKNLIETGYKDGRKFSLAAPQSKHFKCTACHNMQKEDPDLRVSDPEARLEYALENDLPFLQGTTLYGAVNRMSFYNDDYEKKYGDLVRPARNNLREAIQLCAVECSQGRRLKDKELESVLAYLWTLQFKLSDLDLDAQAMKQIKKATQNHRSGERNNAILKLVKSHYLSGSPAHFIPPPSDRKAGAPYTGRPEKGKLIYDLSCKHCHFNQRYSYYNLNDSKLSMRHLARHASKYSRYSIYQVARYGTSPFPGKRSYMPQYPVEKMNEQQLEDLRAYLDTQSEN